MFFMDSSHRLTQSMLNSDVPSVNIRMMDQVMHYIVFQRDTAFYYCLLCMIDGHCSC